MTPPALPDPDNHLRLLALTDLREGRLTPEDVARRLGLSVRQILRLSHAFEDGGEAALVHGNRGRRPANATEAEIAARIYELATTTYKGFNHRHLADMLREHEEIAVSESTVRRVLAARNVPPPRRRRAPKHRSRRERRSRAGMLVQADGSDHRWLEQRGPKITLVAAIDDATGDPWATFRESEDTEGYFHVLRTITAERGIPHAWYTDRASIFTTSDRFRTRDPIFEEPKPTQFGRLLGELGVELILANSPQGKGRIERFWDTAQSRLVSLLRIHDARTLTDANHVLPMYLHQHRQRFSVPARDLDPAWLPWSSPLSPDDVFCLKYQRILGRDHTISLDGRVLDIPDLQGLVRPGMRLTVHQEFAGTIRIFHGSELVSTHLPAIPLPVPRKPADNHPWRR